MNSAYTIEHLTFRYPTREKPALDDINLDIRAGEFVTLCGKSGCGKSTLLRHLKTVLTPHGKRDGQIRFFGTALEKADFRTQSEKIGFVLQNPDNQIVTDKVWHELAFGLESLGCDKQTIRLRVAEMASFFGIQQWFHQNVAELSGGQKQLLNLAAIMAMQPSVLILDEPTSQLDPIAASEFLETVKKINRELGLTVLLTEHRLEEVFPVSDRVVVMDGGRILCDDSPARVGERLRGSGHDMFLSMPAPVRIYAGVDAERVGPQTRPQTSSLTCPLTVKEGRRWLSALFGGEADGGLPAPASSAGRTDGGSMDALGGLAGAAALDDERPAELHKAAWDAAGHTLRVRHTADLTTEMDGCAAGPAGNAAQVMSGVDKRGEQPETDVQLAGRDGGTADCAGNCAENPSGVDNSQKMSSDSAQDRRGRDEKPMIELRDVWFRYERELPDVVKDLSLRVQKGEIFCIVGGNGTGKTTALTLIGGINRPYRGKVLLGGREIRKIPDAELYHQNLGVLPQNPQALFVKKTVELDLYEMLSDRRLPKDEQDRRVREAAEICEVTGLLASHPYDLSGGEQQRAALAKVLLLEPKVLLLDEPTKGLDNHFKRKLAGILRRLTDGGVTVVMVSHDIEFCAEYADRCAMFFDGSITSDGEPRAFFAGNSFYTTAANRMARHLFPGAVTVGDVIEEANGRLGAADAPDARLDGQAAGAAEGQMDQTGMAVEETVGR